jgi:hypothetical protein
MSLFGLTLAPPGGAPRARRLESSSQVARAGAWGVEKASMLIERRPSAADRCAAGSDR